MTRFLNRSSQVAIDLGVLSASLFIAFFTRFDWSPPAEMLTRLVIVWPYVVGFQYAVLYLFGIPRFSWRHIGLREVTRILAACGTAALVLLVLRIAANELKAVAPAVEHALVPIGVNVIDFAAVFLGITGVRVMRRLSIERADRGRRPRPTGEAVPTILIGAGQAGLLVAKELAHRPDLGVKPVGFLDDDLVKVGTVVHGLPVLGTTDDIASVCQARGVKEALITIADASGKQIRRIDERCRSHGIATKIIPGIYEIVGGRVNLSRIRKLEIEDLLGREPVQLDETALSYELSGRVVLVTGAGGSIGSELCRQVCRFGPARLVLVEQAENALFHIHRELLDTNPTIELVPCIADICDEQRMTSVFARYRPSVVFHAAAHKHVPMMEWNAGEAIKNNVLGTRLLTDIAHQHEVAVFVMISTDKAVNPTSIMGATKRVAELYAQALAQHSTTRFVTVRFGNVLGSAGSVIPIFNEQIARGGPVTVTHPDMKRYFMTIPEACQLVMQAGTMGLGGEIFVLDMGEPVKIVDLARDLIRLSGLVPGEDIEIKFSGVRPGEKLFEELSVNGENASKTRHPKIFIGTSPPRDLAEVVAGLQRLAATANHADLASIRAQLRELVPEYGPGGDPGDGVRVEPLPARAVTAVRAAELTDRLRDSAQVSTG
jgi:FlaA1/EpsC-like NDP-sugar epimerase